MWLKSYYSEANLLSVLPNYCERHTQANKENFFWTNKICFFVFLFNQDITHSLPFHRISLDQMDENSAIDQDLQVRCKQIHFCEFLCLSAHLYCIGLSFFRVTWCSVFTAALRSKAMCHWAMAASTTQHCPNWSATWRAWAEARISI